MKYLYANFAFDMCCLIALCVWLICPVHSQTKPPVASKPAAAAPAKLGPGDVEVKATVVPLPTLKPDVELVLTKLQRDLSLLLLQETQLQNQFTQMEKQKPALQAELQSKTASALKDSGIDEKLYELDPNTLQVKQRTTPAPAAPPAKP